MASRGNVPLCIIARKRFARKRSRDDASVRKGCCTPIFSARSHSRAETYPRASSRGNTSRGKDGEKIVDNLSAAAALKRTQ